MSGGVIPPNPFEIQAIQDSVFLFNNVHVFASGNDNPFSSDLYPTSASRYTISVGGSTEDGTPASYSSFGASVLVAAPTGSDNRAQQFPVIGSGLLTTDLVGDFGQNLEGIEDEPFDARDFFPDLSYTSRFGGTSGAAPIVTGTIALMLQANPNLSFRDIEHILVRSARQTSFNYVDADSDLLFEEDADFFQNGAGFSFSYGLGHGVIDTDLAVRMAEEWTPVTVETTRSSPSTVDNDSEWIFPGESGDIPECDPEGICPGRLFQMDDVPGFPFVTPSDFPDDMVVEWVEVTINIDIDPGPSGLFEILLQSPSGTTDVLTNTLQDVSALWSTGDGTQITFRTNNFWGERIGGSWILDFQNFSPDMADLNTVRWDFFGTEAAGSGRVQGEIVQDLNGNGLFDTETDIFGGTREAEPNVAGAVVYVDLNENGQRESFEPHFMTGHDGNWYFDLDPNPTGNDYIIRTELPPGMQLTAGSNPLMVSPTPGNSIITAPMLVDPLPIVVTGTVFLDNDLSGTLNGDPPATNYTVFADLNGDGIPNAGDVFTTTNAAGEYSLSFDTGPGFYSIHVIEDNNLVSGTPDDGFYYMSFLAGELAENVDFGLIDPNADPDNPGGGGPGDPPNPTGGSISGLVFNDVDGNGIRTGGEATLPGWLVFLDLNRNGVVGVGEPTLRSGSDGSFLFTGLQPNNYALRVIPQPGWTQTAPGGDGSFSIDVFPQMTDSGNFFGFRTVDSVDFGDLPVGYAVTLAEDGPRHPHPAWVLPRIDD